MSLYINDIMGENDDTNSDLSDHGRFLTKGAFLLTPSYDLSLDKAASICDKLNFRGSFSLTKLQPEYFSSFPNLKTISKFSGRVSIRFGGGGRAIPNEMNKMQQFIESDHDRWTPLIFHLIMEYLFKPQKTFSLLVMEVPSDLPEDDIRASLYRYASVVEVTRVPNKLEQPGVPNPIRITLASLDEYNNLLQHGLDFYGATYFPTEPLKKDDIRANTKQLLPVFDAAGFSRLPAPASRTLKPRIN